MSSPQKEETLAGHPPAVKVGGMRVGQSHHHHATEKISKAERKQQEEEFQTEVNDSTLVVSGAEHQDNKELSPEAVKVAHEKPQPTREKPPQKGRPQGQPTIHLMQPGKH